MKEHKTIAPYLNAGQYCVLIPVYYENETRPAWRKYYIGSQEAAQEVFKAAPDYLNATTEENKKNRENILKQIIFYTDRGDTKKADALKKQYKFN